MTSAENIFSVTAENVSADRFREQYWESSFEEYLDLVTKHPQIARNAFQRLYEMIIHFRSERYTHVRDERVRHQFFSDPIDNGADAIFGLDRSPMNLVGFFKSVARRYGTVRRILLMRERCRRVEQVQPMASGLMRNKILTKLP